MLLLWYLVLLLVIFSCLCMFMCWFLCRCVGASQLYFCFFFLIPLDCFQRLFIGSQPLIRAKVQHTKEHRMLLFTVLVWLLPRVCSRLLYIFCVYTCNPFFFFCWNLSNTNRHQAAQSCFFPIVPQLWNNSWIWLTLLYALRCNEAGCAQMLFNLALLALSCGCKQYLFSSFPTIT